MVSGSVTMLLWTVLGATTLQEAPTAAQWTDQMHEAFVDLKTSLLSAPALGLQDHTAFPKRGFCFWPVGVETRVAV